MAYSEPRSPVRESFRCFDSSRGIQGLRLLETFAFA
jgi:hypothetical protein